MITFTPEHDKIVRGFAYKAWRRAQASGAASLQVDDVYGELMIAWCVARDKFDESKGVPFGAYLVNGMQVAINRFLSRQIEHGQMESLSLDFEYGESDDSVNLHNAVADERGLAGVETFERDDARDAVMERLTPKTRAFVELLREPPAFMLHAVKARRARQEFARQIERAPTPEADRVTAAMVFEFLELGHFERNRVYAELKRLRHD